eukprot:jgi/Astpho2/8270/fgenesh1_pg.00122_%23_41_t
MALHKHQGKLWDRGPERPFRCRASSPHGLGRLASAASSVKGHTQATVIIEQSGLSIRWEDASKTLQSSIFLRTSIFSAFTLRGPKQMFGVHLGVLTDTLQVFVATGIELQLKYPGINSDLECQMQDRSGANSEFGGTHTEVNLTARVDSIEMQPLRDWADHWKEPHSYFLAPGAILKEIIEDLEWAASSTNSCVRVRLKKDPQQLIFSGEGAGDLEIEVPVCDLNGFKCAETSVSHRYKYKHLKTALSNIPQRDPAAVNSKVLIDAEGMMKVTHMVQMPNLQHENWGAMPSGHDSSQQTQGPKLGVIQCMLLNEGELGEGD